MGLLGQALWEDLEGAGGKGGGRGDRDGEDMWTQGLFISVYDKIHYKFKKKKKEKKNPNRWCCESAPLNMPANLENSAVAMGREKKKKDIILAKNKEQTVKLLSRYHISSRK